MKYLEELIPGSIFSKNDSIFILTCDFKKNGSKLAISLQNGLPAWFSGLEMVDICPIYKLDSENNVVSINNISHQN